MSSFIQLLKSLKTPAKYLLYFFIAFVLFYLFGQPPEFRDEVTKKIRLYAENYINSQQEKNEAISIDSIPDDVGWQYDNKLLLPSCFTHESITGHNYDEYHHKYGGDSDWRDFVKNIGQYIGGKVPIEPIDASWESKLFLAVELNQCSTKSTDIQGLEIDNGLIEVCPDSYLRWGDCGTYRVLKSIPLNACSILSPHFSGKCNDLRLVDLPSKGGTSIYGIIQNPADSLTYVVPLLNFADMNIAEANADELIEYMNTPISNSKGLSFEGFNEYIKDKNVLSMTVHSSNGEIRKAIELSSTPGDLNLSELNHLKKIFADRKIIDFFLSRSKRRNYQFSVRVRGETIRDHDFDNFSQLVDQGLSLEAVRYFNSAGLSADRIDLLADRIDLLEEAGIFSKEIIKNLSFEKEGYDSKSNNNLYLYFVPEDDHQRFDQALSAKQVQEDDSKIDLKKGQLTTTWWKPEQKKAEGYILNGKRNGKWQGWHPNGDDRYVRYYENGEIEESFEYEMKKNNFLVLKKFASFDCSKSRSLVENMICSNLDLGILDYDLSRIYFKKVATSNEDQKQILRDEQRKWIKTRNRCENKSMPSSTHECLKKIYKDRINQLKNGQKVASAKETSGGMTEIKNPNHHLDMGKGNPNQSSFDGAKGYPDKNNSVNVKYKNSINGMKVDVIWEPFDSYGGYIVGEATIRFEDIKTRTSFSIYHSNFGVDKDKAEILNLEWDDALGRFKFDKKTIHIDNKISDTNDWHKSDIFFYDLDFDGNKELITYLPGLGNRGLGMYNVYEIKDGNPVYKGEEPYSGLDARSTIDRENKTISLYGSAGACNSSEKIYRFKPTHNIKRKGKYILEKVYVNDMYKDACHLFAYDVDQDRNRTLVSKENRDE